MEFVPPFCGVSLELGTDCRASRIGICLTEHIPLCQLLFCFLFWVDPGFGEGQVVPLRSPGWDVGTWPADTGVVVRPWARRPTAAGNRNCLLRDLISSAAAHTSSRHFFPICPEMELISRHTQHSPKSLVTVLCTCLQFVSTRPSRARGEACPVSLMVLSASCTFGVQRSSRLPSHGSACSSLCCFSPSIKPG